MAEMVLKSKGIYYTVLYDDCFIDEFKKYVWHITNSGYCRGCINPQNWKEEKRKYYFMHRIVLNCHVDCSMCVDHIDRNRINNTKSNLRIATVHKNTSNREIKNKTGIIGVKCSIIKSGKIYYSAYINVNKRHFIGYFKDIDSAINYRKKLELIFLGEKL